MVIRVLIPLVIGAGLGGAVGYLVAARDLRRLDRRLNEIARTMRDRPTDHPNCRSVWVVDEFEFPAGEVPDDVEPAITGADLTWGAEPVVTPERNAECGTDAQVVEFEDEDAPMMCWRCRNRPESTAIGLCPPCFAEVRRGDPVETHETAHAVIRHGIDGPVVATVEYVDHGPLVTWNVFERGAILEAFDVPESIAFGPDDPPTLAEEVYRGADPEPPPIYDDLRDAVFCADPDCRPCNEFRRSQAIARRSDSRG